MSSHADVLRMSEVSIAIGSKA